MIANRTKRGRPIKGHLLAGLAHCGVCGGPMHSHSARKRGEDGTIRRRYVCRSHSEYHAESAEYCPAMPIDAVEADRLVLSGLDRLLADPDTIRAQLDAGRAAEIERLGKLAEEARVEADRADRVVARAQQRYEAALAEEDAEAADIALTGREE